MKKVYMGIDIGTDSIKYVVGEHLENRVHVLASHTIKTKGVRKGVIVDSVLLVNSLKDGLKELDEKLGIPLRKCLINVPSYNAKFLYVEDSIDITSPNNVITSEDITTLLKKVTYSKLDIDYELVTVMPIGFIIDDKKDIKIPVGSSGQKLGLKGIMISVPKKNIYPMLGVMEEVGLEVVDITFNGIADYHEVRNDSLDKHIGAIINIGHDTTTVSIINKSKFMNTEILQIGGRNVEKDISRIFGINLIDSRLIKERFASAHKRFSNVSEIYEVKNNTGNMIKLNQLEVSEVVMERLKEILEYAKKQILLLTKNEIQYIVLVGETTEFKNFKYLAYEILGKDVIIYSGTTLGVRESRYTSAIGMIKYIINKMDIRGRNYTMLDATLEEELIAPRSKKNKYGTIKKIGKILNIKEESKK